MPAAVTTLVVTLNAYPHFSFTRLDFLCFLICSTTTNYTPRWRRQLYNAPLMGKENCSVVWFWSLFWNKNKWTTYDFVSSPIGTMIVADCCIEKKRIIIFWNAKKRNDKSGSNHVRHNNSFTINCRLKNLNCPAEALAVRNFEKYIKIFVCEAVQPGRMINVFVAVGTNLVDLITFLFRKRFCRARR